ncbi:MAG TPA: alcohol dehydrogenase catalytic domain-containing protein [Acidimicrobiia bacterium]|jgi:(R,R)-butanediol dehydrogenase/meso-butanediol dehydrogenase/diacetyl reductase|nr:alcohol dehydrogenase catalytic domain-containing protein [Acidimicrobiia bacterium]
MPPDIMPAAVYVGQGNLEVRPVPVPPIGPDDVLVEVSHCGICGTDLHLVLEQYARPGAVLGHEWAGTVAAVGEHVDGWALGTPVVAGPEPGCGQCRPCRRGRPSVCLRRPAPDYLGFNGAFCRFVRAQASRLLRVPEGLTLRAAALTEPTAIALHAAHLAGVTDADRVLVTGAGPVGLLITAVLRSLGVDDVTVSEPAAVRRRRALEVGATRTLTPEDLPPVPIGRTAEHPFTVAFECSGRPGAAAAALDHLDCAGTLVFVGTGHDWPRVNHNRMIVLELTAIGAYNYDADGWAPALEMLASGRLPVDLLVEPTDIGLDGLLPAMQLLARGERAAKVLVRPGAAS